MELQQSSLDIVHHQSIIRIIFAIFEDHLAVLGLLAAYGDDAYQCQQGQRLEHGD